MNQDPRPPQRKGKGRNPAPPATSPDVVIPKEKPVAIKIELIEFAPTPGLDGNSLPPNLNIDTALEARRRVRRLIVALGALALLSVVLCFGLGLYHSFKTWRATALALQGEELIRKNQIEKAIPAIRSAYMLSPNAPEVLRAMAKTLTVFQDPGAMTYWNWVLQTKDATDDDRRDAAGYAMRNSLYSEASHIIKDLLARNGGDVRNQLLAAQWNAKRGTPAQTLYYATRAVNDDPNYKPAIFFLAIHQLAYTSLHQNGVNSLFRLAGDNDDIGLVALRVLAHDPDLKPAEIDLVITRLRSHPFATEPDRITALAFEIKRHPDQRESLIDQAMAAHQTTSPVDLATFAQWLNSNNEAARVLKLIPRERAFSNKDLFGAYLDALGGLKRWDDVKTELSSATVPIEAPLVELYLSRYASEMGDDMGSDLHWKNAVSAAAGNPTQSLHLAVYAEKLGQNERAAAVYRALTQEPSTGRIAYLGLLRVSNDKDTLTLRDLLEEMVSRWPKDDAMETQYIFLNLLLNERAPEMHQRAFSLLADDFYNISHHTNLALACLRLNDPAAALGAYSHFTIDLNTAPAPDRVVYAAVLNANGMTKVAHQLLLTVKRDALRPELRDLIKSIP